jgi:hypothetical protein
MLFIANDLPLPAAAPARPVPPAKIIGTDAPSSVALRPVPRFAINSAALLLEVSGKNER